MLKAGRYSVPGPSDGRLRPEPRPRRDLIGRELRHEELPDTPLAKRLRTYTLVPHWLRLPQLFGVPPISKLMSHTVPYDVTRFLFTAPTAI